MQLRNALFAAIAALSFPAAAADTIPIVDDGQLAGRWVPLAPSQHSPAYPLAYADTGDNVCVTVGYVVDENGATSDHALLKSWSSANTSARNTAYWGAFAEAASRAVSQYRFEPAAGAPAKAVFTSTTFAFGPGDQAATREHCAIADLTTRMVELRRTDRAGRMMTGGVYARLEIDPVIRERMDRQLALARERSARRGLESTRYPLGYTPPASTRK